MTRSTKRPPFGDSFSDGVRAMHSPEDRQEIAEINAALAERAQREEEERSLDGEVNLLVQDAADYDSEATTAVVIDRVLANRKTTKAAVEASLKRLAASKAIHQTGGLWKPR